MFHRIIGFLYFSMRRCIDIVAEPFYFLIWFFLSTCHFLYHTFRLQNVWGLIGSVFIAIGDYLGTWFATRRLQWLLGGLPALVAVVLLGTVVLIQWQLTRNNTESVASRYRMAAQAALAANQFEQADVMLRKLAQLTPFDPATQYSLGVLAEKQDNMRQAYQRMSRIAPDVSTGYAPAHLWLAQQLISEKTNEPLTEDETGWLIHHLESSLDTLPKPYDAHLLLAKLYNAARHRESAVVQYAIAGERWPIMRLNAAGLYQQLGQTDAAAEQLQLAYAAFQKRIATNNADNGARLGMSRICLALGRPADAEQVLHEGLRIKDQESLHKELAVVYVNLFDRLHRKQPVDQAKLLEVLQAAMAEDPENQVAISRLGGMIGLGGEVGALARQELLEMLADGRAPAAVHLALGSQLAIEGDLAAARLHLEQAKQLNPKLPVVLNNLAWVIAHADQPDLEAALALSDQAMSFVKDSPAFHETQGQILTKMQRWSEAIPHLEIAVKQFKIKEVHFALYKCYDGLGQSELAELHKQEFNKRMRLPGLPGKS